jgi:glycosyltransferase involved in cell wall biosynthesis
MRVLIVAHGYPPTHFGGAELRAERTALGLRQRGHDVAVLCVESASTPSPPLPWEDRWQDGVLVRRVTFDLRSSPDPFLWSHDNPLIGQALTDLVRSWQPVVLHLFSGYLTAVSAVRVGKSHGLPLVVSLTDYFWLCHRINLLRPDQRRCDGPTLVGCTRCSAEEFRRFRLPARHFPAAADGFWRMAARIPPLGNALHFPAHAEGAAALAACLRDVDALVAPSEYLAKKYIAYGADPGRMRVRRQGVNVVARPPRRTAADGALRVGYIGQVKPHKGVDLLLEAWPLLRGDRPRTLVLYGAADGVPEYGKRVRARLPRLGGVTWGGQFGAGEVWQVLAGLDVLVVPSRWVENSPNSILEAQAMGVPVVGSDLGGVAELVQHGRNGLLFGVDDAPDLARQIQRLLDEPGLRDQLSSQALPVSSVEDEVREIEELYLELVQPAAAAPASASSGKARVRGG